MIAPIPKEPSNTLSRQAAAPTAWAPFTHRTFTVIWIATVISNIGGWMYNVASGWLMTSLNSETPADKLRQSVASIS